MNYGQLNVIHHSADFDGLFCRAIAQKFLFLPPDTVFIGWDFKDKPLPTPLPEDARFIVMDLPIDRVFGFEFKGEKAVFKDGSEVTLEWCNWNNFTWIDHHKSAIQTHPKDIPGYRIEGVSACRLAWQWFLLHQNWDIREQHPPYDLPALQDYIDRKVNEPLAVRLAGEYDIFDKRDPNAQLFQFGLNGINPDYQRLLADCADAVEYVDYILRDIAPPVKCARDNEYSEVIQQQGFELVFSGINFLACCSHNCDIRSQLFEAGIKPNHDALIGFTFNGDQWRFSMYQIPGKEHVDILSLAGKFKGGGHPGACGFMTNPKMGFQIIDGQYHTKLE